LKEITFYPKDISQCQENRSYIWKPSPPQSQRYKGWVKKEFKNLAVLFREVPFVKSDGGHKRMTRVAKNML